MENKSAAYTFKYWAHAIIADAVMLAALYLWKAEGSEGAANVFLFGAWLFTILMLVVGIFADKTSFGANPRPWGFAGYHYVSEAVLIVLLAWFGMFFLAGIRTFAVLIFEAARKREPKSIGPASGGAA